MNLNKNNVLGEVAGKLSVLIYLAFFLYILSLYIHTR